MSARAQAPSRITTLECIRSAAYRVPGHFADVDEFVRFIWPRSVRGRSPLSGNLAVVKHLRHVTHSHRFLSRDLKLLSKEIGNNWGELCRPFEERIASFQTQAAAVLKGKGLSYVPAPVRVVEKFPQPFDATSFDALTIDKFDEEDFGIPHGIYFLRSQLVPDLAIHTYAHEMVHHLISEHTSARLLARGVEEGLCEVFGALYLEWQTRGLCLAETIHRNSMFAETSDPFWDNYVHHTRQFVGIFHLIGIPGLVEIIRRGRGYLKELEKAFLSGNWRTLLPRNLNSQTDDEFGRMLDRLFIGFNRNYIVSPEIYEMAGDLRPGLTLGRLAKRRRMQVSKLRGALTKFQERNFLLLMEGDRIAYSDVPMYLEAGSLRYSLKSTKYLG